MNKFEFTDNSYAVVKIEELEKSRPLLKYDGKYPKNRPLSHFDFIKEIENILKDAKIKYDPAPIYISKQNSYYIGEGDSEKNMIEKYVFTNLVTSFNIPALSDDEKQFNIALSYTQKGITVALGVNIHVCSNQTILGSGNYMRTFGDNSIPYKEMLTLIEFATQSFEQKWNDYNNAIEKMKTTLLQKHKIHSLVGALHINAVRNAYVSKSDSDVFNISDISLISKYLLESEAYINNETISLWDFYNVCTDILTHDMNNIPDKHKMIFNIGNFLLNYTDTVIEDEVTVIDTVVYNEPEYIVLD